MEPCKDHSGVILRIEDLRKEVTEMDRRMRTLEEEIRTLVTRTLILLTFLAALVAPTTASTLLHWK